MKRQLDDCEALVEQLGWEVAQRFSDNDISAFSGRIRPGYEDMLSRIEAGEFDALVCWHTDRLHRSPVELERFIAIVEGASIAIRTVKGGDLDLSNSAGRMVARILGSVARQESEHSSERRKRANDQRAAAGVWHTSRRPFGYTADGRPFEPEATALSTAVADVLSGKSIRQVAREWNGRGLRTTSVGSEWRSASVRRVLSNPRYAALRVHRGEVLGQGDWEPLIDVDQHHGILAIFADNSRSSKVTYERKWQGSGVYRCGVCGDPVVIHAGARKLADGTSVKVRSYKCPKNHVRRQGEALDEFVDALVIGRLSRPDAHLLLDDGAGGVDTAALQVERDVLRARLDSFGVMLGDGTMDGGQFELASKTVRGLLDAVDAQLATARIGSPIADLVLSGEELGERWRGLSADLRGKVIEALLTVEVLPSPKGLRRFDPEWLRVVWKGQNQS